MKYLLTQILYLYRMVTFSAPVAQLDRVFGYEPKGRAFESLRVHHHLRAHRLAVRTSPFHGGNGGSIPPGRARLL